MKGAIVCADIVSTVSPHYAEEIRSPEYAHRLDTIINENAHKLIGILNGIDYTYYNPENDTVIPLCFSAADVSKKSNNKTVLQQELGLPCDKEIPMLAIISRLATHKGIDLVSQMAQGLLENHDVQLVVLGKGDSGYESFFRELESCFPNKMRALICYDRDLSKKIYAAADIFVMPSKSEPCGLSQMIASRYGAVPVVRETGGLYDSIQEYCECDGELRGNGFTFANYLSTELYNKIVAAKELYYQKEKWEAFVAKVMKTDFSWAASAIRYLEMYRNL